MKYRNAAGGLQYGQFTVKTTLIPNNELRFFWFED